MALPEDNKKFLRETLGADPLTAVCEWISENMDPEEVFSEQDLEQWAKSKGYKYKDLT